MKLTITIRTDTPPPENPRRYGFAEIARRTLAKLPEGGSFEVSDDSQRVKMLGIASELRIGIVTQKVNGGYRIWRKGGWKQRRRGHPIKTPTTTTV